MSGVVYHAERDDYIVNDEWVVHHAERDDYIVVRFAALGICSESGCTVREQLQRADVHVECSDTQD